MGENSIINTSESRVKDWLTKEQSVVRDLSRVPKERQCDRANIAIGVDRRDIDVDREPIKIPSENQEIREEFKSRRVERQEKVKVENNHSNDSAIIESYESILIVEGRGRRETIELTDRSQQPSQPIETNRDIFHIIVQEQVEKERQVKKKSLRKYREFTSRTRGFLSSASSSCARLIQRIIVLFLSLLGNPLSPLSQQYSGLASRGLYTGSFFALVSLLVLLHPSMAIPTVTTLGNDSGASGVTGTASTRNLTFNETSATLPSTISHSRTNPVAIDEHHHRHHHHHHHHHHHSHPQHREEDEQEVRDDQVLNFESGATGTKGRGLRRSLEYTSRQFTNEEEEDEVDDEEEDDDDDDHDDDDDDDDDEEEDEEEEEEDAFPASVIPHTRQSGHEMGSRLPKAELDTIRRSIVEGLGLERIPDPSKANVSQTEYRRAHEEYLTRLQHSRDSGDGRQRRLHTFHPAERAATTKIDRKRRSLSANEIQIAEKKEKNGVLFFPVTITEENSLVDHATLRLLLDVRDTSIEGTNHAVSLYRLTSSNSREFIVRQVLSKSYMARGPRWIELDATKLANLWYDENQENEISVELKFECLDTRRKLGKNEKQPLVINPVLNIFTTSDESSEDFGGFRRKRRANPEHLMSLHKGRRTECRGENKKCCRHEMSVIFKDLKGFEFIVQPKNFDAGYCKGRCPPRYNPAHHHAFLQSLIWKEDRRKAPRPCCAPSKLDELEILYFDENDPTKLKISSWKNMKVLECACS